MSALLGQKRTISEFCAMSAYPSKADIIERDRHVRFVPKADSCTAAKELLFDQLISALQKRFRNCQPDCFAF